MTNARHPGNPPIGGASRIRLLALLLIFASLLSLTLYLKTKGVLAAWWPSQINGSGYLHRQMLTLTNSSASSLSTGTTVSVNIDTQTLSTLKKIKANCNDVRIVYQPNSTTFTELNRNLVYAGGSTCATSGSTKVYFPLQNSLASGASDSTYYIYYGNPQSTAPTGTQAAYNVTGATATFVCPFDGSTTCVAAGSGTPTTATGAIRYSGSKTALSFNGTSAASVDAGSSSSLDDLPTGAFTAEAWVKANSQGNLSQGTIIEKGSAAAGTNMRFRLGYNGLNTIRADLVSAGSIVSNVDGTMVANGTWHHLAMTYNNSGDRKMRLYIDGALQGTGAAVAVTLSTDNVQDLYVGTQNSASARWWDGLIDEVRISNLVRYSGAFTPQTSPFVRDTYTKLLLHMDENGSDPRNAGKAIDDSGNGNNGTITGATYVSGLVGVDSTSSDVSLPNSSFASHNGVFVEEGTTNKITNPSFEASPFNTNWAAADGTLNYSATHTFTPAIAKRTPPAGPFAAGVMVQGDMGNTQSDDVKANTGSVVSGGFSQNFDNSQGSIAFWITPEWNGNDNLDHYLLQTTNQNGIFKNTSNNLILQINGTAATGPSLAAWTAGSTYGVIIRWDTKNTLNGTNYYSVTVNNITTFTGTSIGTLGTPTWIEIGSRFGSAPSANALIQGLTIYRRPLYEATTPSGINGGNGDEITQIYNGGTGKDPTLVTGSWDVVFALPTNSSTGSLSTTGEAWSHPHTSNLLYTNTTNTGGFMMNGTYTNDGWAAIGSPTVAALSSAAKIYPGGYSVQSSGSNQGIKYTTGSLASGASYVLRALGNSDGTCNPIIKVFRADGTTLVTSLAGTTTSTRTAPDTYIFTWQTSAAEAEQIQLLNTAATGTCSWHQVEVQSNLVTNPSMETGSGDPWISTGWQNSGSGTGGITQSTGAGNVWSGTSASLINAGNNKGVNTNNLESYTVNIGDFWSIGTHYKLASAGYFRFLSNRLINQTTTNTGVDLSPTSTSWGSIMAIARRGGSCCGSYAILQLLTQNASPAVYVDDTYAFRMSPVSLTLTPASEANSTETSGLRVDGADTLTQTINNLTASSGTVEVNFTPRHSWAANTSFGTTTPVIFRAWANSTNYISLFRNGNLRLQAYFGSSIVNMDVASPTLNAGTTYNIKATYNSSGNLALYINGVLTGTPVAISGATFATLPTTLYLGSDSTGINQYDGTFAAATVTAPTVTANTTSPYYKFGSASAQLVAVDASNYVTTINPGNTNTNTLSAYVYDGTSGNVGGTVDAKVATLIWEGVAVAASYSDQGGGWWRLTYAAATANSANAYGVHVADGKTVYVDGVQLEEKTHVTTFVDGSLGTGYAWTGTANNSTSTRTAGTLNYPVGSGNFSGSEGTVSLWIKPVSLAPTGGSYVLNIGSGGGRAIMIDPSTSKFGTSSWSGCTNITAATGYTLGNWYNLVLTWSQTTGTCQFFINNSSQGSANGFNGAGSWEQIAVGQYRSASYEANSSVSDLRIFNAPLSSTQVADLYNAGLVSHSEASQVDAFSNDLNGQNPVAIWHMDDPSTSSGQASDSSIYGHTLTLSNVSWNTDSTSYPSKRVRSLLFNGTSSYATRTWDKEFDFGTSPFSISGWFRHPSTSSGQQTILARYGTAGYKVYMNSSGYICFGIDDTASWTPKDSVCTTTSYADALWHHFEAVRDVSSIAIYMDGNLITTNSSLSSSGSLSSSANIYLGVDSTGNSNYFSGYLDEITIYPYARSATQVKVDYVGDPTGTYIGASANDPLSSGLVGYWKMDETSGTLADSSGAGNTGTWNGTGASHYTTGKFGNGGGFNGSDDFVNAGTGLNNIFTNRSSTISVWVNPATIGNYGRIIAKGDPQTGPGWELGVRPDSGYQLRFAIRRGGVRNYWTIGNIALSTWSHLTVTYDGSLSSSIPKIYINGILQSSYGSSITEGIIDDDTGQSFRIGSSSSNFYYTGLEDEVRVYNRALSPAEVSQLYTYAPGPIGYWGFDEGAGTTIADKSGNGRSGSWNGSGASHWVNGKVGKAGNFDGSSDYVSFTSSTFAQMRGNFTYETWFFLKNKPPNRTTAHIVGINPAGNWASIYYDIYDAIDRLEMNVRFTDWSSQYIYGPAIATGQWHHVALTADSTTINAYLDGAPIGGPYNYSGKTIGAQTNNFQIGNTAFSGSIDETKVYNYARTQKQIIQDMNTGASVISRNGPVAYLKLDEGAGSTTNNSGSSGTTLRGTATNTTWSNAGMFGKALTFSGSSSYVRLVNATNVSSGMTFSGWFKTTVNSAGNATIFTLSNAGVRAGPSLIMVSGGLRFHNGSLWCATTTNTYNNNLWHHVALVIDGNTQNMYVDGKVDGTSTCTYNANNTDAPLIGASYSSGTPGGNSYTGSLDEIKLYSYPLSSDEVKLDYNRGSAIVYGSLSDTSKITGTPIPVNSANAAYCIPGDSTSCAPPVAEWNFDEGSGGTVKDTSGNNNVGSWAGTGTHWIQGKQGFAGKFNGSDDLVTVTQSGSINNLQQGTMTAEVWAKITTYTTPGQYYQLLKKTTGYPQKGWYLYIVGGKPSISVYANDVADMTTCGATDNYTLGSWAHIAFTFNNVTDRKPHLFVNGVETSCSPTAPSGAMGSENANLLIGTTSSTGLIDQAKIFNYARTPAQIAWDYNQGKPVAWYKLNECSGTIAHNSALNGNGQAAGMDGTIVPNSGRSVGTCSSGVSTEMWNGGTSGKYGGSLAFDGSGDYIQTGNFGFNPGGTSSFSLSTWFKASTKPSSGKYKSLIMFSETGQGDAVYDKGLSINSAGQLDFYTWPSTPIYIDGTTDVTDNTWHQGIVIYDGSALKIYVDGKLQTNSNMAGSYTFTTPQIVLSFNNGNWQYFNGQLDDVRIYNYPLTETQVQTLYNENSAVRFGP